MRGEVNAQNRTDFAQGRQCVTHPGIAINLTTPSRVGPFTSGFEYGLLEKPEKAAESMNYRIMTRFQESFHFRITDPSPTINASRGQSEASVGSFCSVLRSCSLRARPTKYKIDQTYLQRRGLNGIALPRKGIWFPLPCATLTC